MKTPKSKKILFIGAIVYLIGIPWLFFSGIIFSIHILVGLLIIGYAFYILKDE